MLYISPRETKITTSTSGLSTLRDSIKKRKYIKQVMHIGVLSNKSSFHKEMETFQKY